MLRFLLYTNFSLETGFWGSASPIDIIKVLDSVIADFYVNLNPGMLPTRMVLVRNSSRLNPPLTTPMIVQNILCNVIYLATQDFYWAQYAYQFVHELCHHVVDSSFFGGIDRFGWLEESLCELASIYTISKMSTTWLTNAPFPQVTAFAADLDAYATSLLNDPLNVVNEPLHLWLSNNIETLYSNRVLRTQNRIIATQLFPVFVRDPDLWQTIQYINKVVVTNEMDFKTFLSLWKAELPHALQLKFANIELLMINQVS